MRFARPKPGEEGVAVARATRSVHDVETAVGEAAAREQRLDRVARGTRRQRRELVEQRRDHGGVERQQQELERDPRRPRPDPPQRPGGAHQPQHERGERQAEHGADQDALREVGHPERARGPVEAEPDLDAERLHVRERQADDARDHRDRDDQDEVASDPAERQDIGPGDQRREAAAQRQRDEHQRFPPAFRQRRAACARPCSPRPSGAPASPMRSANAAGTASRCAATCPM